MTGTGPVSRPSIPIGLQVMGEYLIEAGLDEGPNWVVYKAVHVNHPTQHFRITALRSSVAARRNLIEAFARQFQLLESLKHPGIIPVIATGVDQGAVFMVTPDMPGESLKTRIARTGRGLETGEVVRIVREIAAVLDYLHGKRPAIAHRAIDPGKIFLTEPDRSAKLLEVGYVFALDSANVDASDIVPYVPEPYRAPEDRAGSKAGAPADQFALACVAYECLSGRAPSVPSATATEGGATRGAGDDGIAPAVAAVIARGRAMLPLSRYPSATAFASALAVACESTTRQPAPKVPLKGPDRSVPFVAPTAVESRPKDPYEATTIVQEAPADLLALVNANRDASNEPTTVGGMNFSDLADSSEVAAPVRKRVGEPVVAPVVPVVAQGARKAPQVPGPPAMGPPRKPTPAFGTPAQSPPRKSTPVGGTPAQSPPRKPSPAAGIAAQPQPPKKPVIAASPLPTTSPAAHPYSKPSPARGTPAQQPPPPPVQASAPASRPEVAPQPQPPPAPRPRTPMRTMIGVGGPARPGSGIVANDPVPAPVSLGSDEPTRSVSLETIQSLAQQPEAINSTAPPAYVLDADRATPTIAASESAGNAPTDAASKNASASPSRASPGGADGVILSDLGDAMEADDLALSPTDPGVAPASDAWNAPPEPAMMPPAPSPIQPLSQTPSAPAIYAGFQAGIEAPAPPPARVAATPANAVGASPENLGGHVWPEGNAARARSEPPRAQPLPSDPPPAPARRRSPAVTMSLVLGPCIVLASALQVFGPALRDKYLPQDAAPRVEPTTTAPNTISSVTGAVDPSPAIVPTAIAPTADAPAIAIADDAANDAPVAIALAPAAIRVETPTPPDEHPVETPPTAAQPAVNTAGAPVAPAQPAVNTGAPAQPVVPATADPAPPRGDLPNHPSWRSRQSAQTDIAQRIAQCPGHYGRHARMVVVYEGSGQVRDVRIAGDYFVGAIGACIEQSVRAVNLPAFSRPTWETDYEFLVR